MTPARLLASGLGAGFLPRAPGTAGAFLGLAAGAALLSWHPAALWVGAAVAIVGGYAAIASAGVAGDPGWVVVDEVAGQLVAMLALSHADSPPGRGGLLAAFALFRAFDIAKPGPVGWADRQEGPFGIMADDVIAGALAGLVLMAARWAGAEW